MSSWRDLFRPRIAAIIADARARGLDEKATMRALKNPYRRGWLAQVWSDERARQRGRTKGRLAPREGSPAQRRRAAIEGGQLDLDGLTHEPTRAHGGPAAEAANGTEDETAVSRVRPPSLHCTIGGAS